MFNFFKSKRKIIEMLENANRKIFDECVYLRNKNHELTQEIKRLNEDFSKRLTEINNMIKDEAPKPSEKFIPKKKKRK